MLPFSTYERVAFLVALIRRAALLLAVVKELKKKMRA
jgi:hypothetical protein